MIRTNFLRVIFIFLCYLLVVEQNVNATAAAEEDANLQENKDPAAAEMFTPERKIGVEIETDAIKIRRFTEEDLQKIEEIQEKEEKDKDEIQKEIDSIIENATLLRGFNFSLSPSPETIWKMETDTLDAAFAGTDNWLFDRNMECMTVGGSSDKAKFLRIVRYISHAMNACYNRAEGELNQILDIDQAFLQQILAGSGFDITRQRQDRPGFSIKLNLNANREVRPQITYQLPLAEIPHLFKRLSAMHKLSPITDFLAFLESISDELDAQAIEAEIRKIGLEMEQAITSSDSWQRKQEIDQRITGLQKIIDENENGNVAELVDPESGFLLKEIYSQLEEEDTYHTHIINNIKERIGARLYLKKVDLLKTDLNAFDLSAKLDSLLSANSRKLHGFCYLFLYYWHNIFIDTGIVPSEPGPKSWLMVMSRVPFAQMYQKLSHEEQQSFKDIFGEFMESPAASKYNLSPYNDYDGRKVDPQINIKDWYDSIISVAEDSRDVEEQEDDGSKARAKRRKVARNQRVTDALSPLPRLPSSYSMGNMDIEGPGIALVEVRGYSILGRTLENVYCLIEQEANWFFDKLPALPPPSPLAVGALEAAGALEDEAS